MSRFIFSSSLLVLLMLGSSPLEARNVDLSTVPERRTVQLTIYNSEDLTLVRETRVVTFKAGLNALQFSWANTLIDPSSVELRFLSGGEELELLDTTFLHDRPQALYWNVESAGEREALIEISYFTSGIEWAADYVAVADSEEGSARMEGFVRVRNRSGEDYERAQVRLVVGQINLVEKIAQLANVPAARVAELDEAAVRDYRAKAMRRELETPYAAEDISRLAAGQLPQTRPKEVVKEGLSEYFIFTIEGTETIPDGWTKRLRSFEAAKVPLRVAYRYREREYGPSLARLYLMTNEKANGLGTTPLPDGMIAVFRQGPQGGLSYLAKLRIPYVPIGEEIELNLGADPNVVFELIKLRSFRSNIWVRLKKGRLFKRIDDDTLRYEHDAKVAGWDEHVVYTQRVRNYSGRAIDVEVRRAYDGDVVFRSELDPQLQDYRTVQFTARVAPGQTQDLVHEIITRQGRNAEQSRVSLEVKSPAEWRPTQVSKSARR
jgi:hypothetical protein